MQWMQIDRDAVIEVTRLPRLRHRIANEFARTEVALGHTLQLASAPR